MHPHDKKKKCMKMVENVSWWPFLCVFNSYHMCACIIACCQLFLNTWMHSWVSAPVFGPDHLFSTTFSYFLAVFIYFQLFSLTIYQFYPFSIVFICFQQFLPKFESYRFFFPFFYIIFNYFHSFSTIFDHFNPFFITLTRISSLSTIMAYFWPPLFIFNHFWWFTIILTDLNCF